MENDPPYYRQIREGVLVAIPQKRYSDSEINQYEAADNDYPRVAALHDRLGVVGKPERFRAILYHFSEPRTRLQDLTSEKQTELLSQWTFYASDVGDAYCICSQPHIRDLRYIRNTKNRNILLVGNDCVEKLPDEVEVKQTNALFTQEAKKTDTCRHCTLTMERSDFEYVGICANCESQETPISLCQLRRYCPSCTNPRVIKAEKGVCDRCYGEGKRLCEDCAIVVTVEGKKASSICFSCVQRRKEARTDEQRRAGAAAEKKSPCVVCKALFIPRMAFHTRCDSCFFVSSLDVRKSLSTTSSTPAPHIETSSPSTSQCESCKNGFKPLQSGHKRCYACYMKSNTTPERRRCDGCNKEFEPLKAHYRLCSGCSYDRFGKR